MITGMITVVIPYYQRSPGIFAKALSSIATQQGCLLPVPVSLHVNSEFVTIEALTV
jgi:hypothetical protein